MNIHSCEHCRRLVLAYERLLSAIETGRSPAPTNRFRFTAAEFAAAEAQCLLFQKVAVESRQGFFGVGLPFSIVPPDPDVVVWIRLDHKPPGLWYLYVWKEPRSTIVYKLLLCSSEDDPAARWLRTRLINSSVKSPSTYSMIKSWLSTCLDKHSHFEDLTEDTGPLRLLNIEKIDGAYRVCLVDREPHHTYTSLSYCWGGDQESKTTKSRLAARMRSIDYETLPRTIQDAVDLTHEIGYTHIWIDALCIVQDDDDEKTIEIAKMPGIYGKAVCTIAASSASAASEGFLQRTEHTAFQFKMRQGDEEGTMYGVEARDFGPEPLESRGWALQQNLLSSRIIDFRRRQVRWHCQGPQPDKPLMDGWVELPETVKEERNPQQEGRSAFRQIDDPYTHWADIVCNYTQRNFTVPSDRVLAISGIANALGRQLDDRYIAGHWMSTLPLSLMWSVNADNKPITRPTSYQGPSWSWTSNNETVHFHAWRTSRGKQYRWTTFLEVLSANCELQHPLAPYGPIKKAILSLRGRLRRVQVQVYKQAPSSISGIRTSHLLQHHLLLDADDKRRIGPCDLDLDSETEDFGFTRNGDTLDGDVILLEVCRQTQYEWSQWNKNWALVVREVLVKGDGCPRYSRLGIARTEDGVFANCEAIVVELV